MGADFRATDWTTVIRLGSTTATGNAGSKVDVVVHYDRTSPHPHISGPQTRDTIFFLMFVETPADLFLCIHQYTVTYWLFSGILYVLPYGVIIINNNNN